MPKPRGPAAPTDTPRKRGRPPSNPDAPRLPSGQYSRGQGIRERGPNARSEHVGCRLTKADAEALEVAAAAAGRKASEWARHLILLGMGVQKLGKEVGADMDGSPESALASIKTRLKAAGKHGLTFGGPVVRPVESYLDLEPDLALAMCDAARWLAERLGCDPGATAPGWAQYPCGEHCCNGETGEMAACNRPVWSLGTDEGFVLFMDCPNPEAWDGEECRHVPGISAITNPAQALAAACMAVGGTVPDALLDATRTKESPRERREMGAALRPVGQ